MLRVIALLASASTLASGQIPESTRKLLDYPHSLLLNLSQTVVDTTPLVRISDIQYDSPHGGRVTGYLVEPIARGRFAGLVFGHWGEGNRTEFLPEAIRYSGVGAVCVLIDYPWARPEPWRRKVYAASTTAEQDLDVLAQAVTDLRRAIDLLLQRSDIDPKRIAYVGHSYGLNSGPS